MLAMKATVWLPLTAVLLATAARVDEPRADEQCPHLLVSTGVMRDVIAGIDDYDTNPTTNHARFVADFLLGLVRHPAIAGTTESLRILPERFLAAWMDATGRPRAEAPPGIRRVLRYDQRFAVDLQPDAAVRGREPVELLAVRVAWPESAGHGASYTYEDTQTEPDVRIRQERVIDYLLIDFGDAIAYEMMTGVAGRPTSGALGALFTLLGMADIESTRHAVAADGTQVNRARVRKLFAFTALATIAPDGTAARGIPDDRQDLQRLAESLDFELDIEMHEPWPQICE